MKEDRSIYKEYKDHKSNSFTRLFDDGEKESILFELGYKKHVVKGYTSHSVYHNDVEYTNYYVEVYLREKYANYDHILNGEGKADELYNKYGLNAVFATELNERMKNFIINKLFE